MFIAESQGLMAKNLASLSKEEFIQTACGYASAGMMHVFPEMVKVLERGLKERIQTFDMNEAVYFLKIFVQAELGSGEGLYHVLERHIGRFGSQIESFHIYPILKSFSLAHHSVPDFDAQKIFIKMQKNVL